MIKLTLENETDIPPALKSFYTQGDNGHWTLQVEGAVPKGVVDEFRNNNIKLQQEVDGLKTKFKDVDPETYRSLKERSAELEEGKLIKKEGLEAAVAARVSTMKAELEGKLTAAEERLRNTTQEMGKLKIDSALVERATKLGLRPEATQDFINRGREVFALDDEGNVTAFETDKKTKRFGAQGTVLSIDEYVQTAAKDKGFSHLFNPSGGSGANGGAKGAGGGVNPFKKGAENLTEQAKLLSSNPTLYHQQKAEAAAAG